MAPDTVSLRYFLVLAQELNFTRAAARIGIAQPALSARMRRLEAELGTALLVRNTRSVVLTTAGAALAESAPPALAALDRAWDTARSAAAGELGTLRIGYSLSAGAETAPALVDRLIRGNSGLEVGAVPMATPEISPQSPTAASMPGSPAVNSRAVACAGSCCGVRASGSCWRSTIRWPNTRRSRSPTRPRIRCDSRTVRPTP